MLGRLLLELLKWEVSLLLLRIMKSRSKQAGYLAIQQL